MLKPFVRTKSHHDEIMDGLEHPFWLVEGSLRDDVWIVCTVDPDRHRKARVKIDFRQPMVPWPSTQTLLDPEFGVDLITIKLVLYYSMKPSPIGWNKAASSLKNTFLAQITFSRWRAEIGVESNSLLRPAHFSAYDKVFKARGRDGLLNMQERAGRILKAVKCGQLTLHDNGRNGVMSTHLARLMGLSGGSSITAISRHDFEMYFQHKGVVFTRTTKSRKFILSKEFRVTRETAIVYYSAWFHLWKLRSLLPHDQIGYQAFKKMRDIGKWVKSNRPIGTACRLAR
jgi:hypothetical protein